MRLFPCLEPATYRSQRATLPSRHGSASNDANEFSIVFWKHEIGCFCRFNFFFYGTLFINDHQGDICIACIMGFV